MADDSRNQSDDYYVLPDCIGIRRIIREYVQLSDRFQTRELADFDSYIPQFLFEHQVQGVKWLLARYEQGYSGAILADDMGLGKTAQAISTYYVLKQLKPEMKLFNRRAKIYIT